MKFRERLEYIAEVNEKAARGEKTDDNRLFERDGRYYIHVDIRASLLRRIEAEGIPKAAVARALGIVPQHLNSYLTKKQNLTYNKVEELLWLLGVGTAATNNKKN